MVGSAITQIQYINDGGPTGFSPLMYAASLCVDNEEMMKELIMLGADVNASNSVEEMVLMFTLLRGKSWSVINLMLEHGLDVNKTMHFKLSLLNIVGVEYLQGLINVGANINHADIWGQSVLYSCVMNRKVENVRILLENGADLNLKTNNGRTPLKCALDLEMDFAKRNEMIRLFQERLEKLEKIHTEYKQIVERLENIPNSPRKAIRLKALSYGIIHLESEIKWLKHEK